MMKFIISLNLVFILFLNSLSAQDAAIQLNNDTLCGINSHLILTDISLGSPTSRDWSITGPAGFTPFTDNISHTSLFLTHIGNYSVQLNVCYASGLCDDTIVNVTVINSPTAIINYSDTLVCYGESVSFDGTSSLYSTTDVQYYWDFDYDTGINDSTQGFSTIANSDQLVMLVVVDDNGCSDTAFQNLSIIHIEEADFSIANQCVGVPFQIYSNNNINNMDTMYWLIDNSTILIGDSDTYTHNIAEDISIHLFVSNNGCDDDLQQTISIEEVPTLSLNISDTTICEDDVLDIIATGGPKFEWNTGDTTSSITVSPKEFINYSVFSLSALGACKSSGISLDVNVVNKPELDFEVDNYNPFIGMEVDFFISIDPQFSSLDSIIWLAHNTSNQLEYEYGFENSFTANENVDFPFQLIYHKEEKSCRLDSIISFEINSDCSKDYIFIPNVFSPNNDGLNDIFLIKGFTIERILDFIIFDRYGQEVVNFSDIEIKNGISAKGWNGMNKNNVLCNSGVFVYHYNVKCRNGEEIQGSGNVTLIR